MLPRISNAPSFLSSQPDQDWSFLNSSGIGNVGSVYPTNWPSGDHDDDDDDDDEPPLRGGYHPMMDEPPVTPPRFESVEEYERWVYGNQPDDDDDRGPPKLSSFDTYMQWANGAGPDEPLAPGNPAHDALGDMMKQTLDRASGPGGTGFVRRPVMVDGFSPPMPSSSRKIPRMYSLEEYLDWTDDPEAHVEDYDSEDDAYVDPDTRHQRQCKRYRNETHDSYDPTKRSQNECFRGGSGVYVKSDIPFTMSRRYPNPNPPVYLGPVSVGARDGNKTMTVTSTAHRVGEFTVPASHIKACFQSITSGYPVQPPWDLYEKTRRMQRGEVACCVAIVMNGNKKVYYVNWQGVNPFWLSWIREEEFNVQDLKDILARSVAPGEEIPVIVKQ